MIVSSLLYLVSVVVPLLVTVETLTLVCKGNGASASALNTLVLQLKYWCLYAILFEAIPSSLSRAVLATLPLAGLALLAAAAAVTAELLRDFTRFAQSQDTRFMFLFNKLSDSNVSWWQWFNYAGAYDENNTARLFVFGQFTQFCVSLANRLPVARTRLLESSFDALQQWLVMFAQVVGRHWKSRMRHVVGRNGTDRSSCKNSSPGSSKYAEGYDLLEDFLQDTKKEQ
ncbi:hypothetical protein HG537_0A05140 [Torulaspora globosa]|uniref:Uncharacterized protein n=1 Tax=Torulaspora globosa TaxID=48254 RepID=A0A7H9HNE1_9SACH|nr:hypothetical protein HG537_0A05140 [Torulaspora sp. CBS 2947]